MRRSREIAVVADAGGLRVPGSWPGDASKREAQT